MGRTRIVAVVIAVVVAAVGIAWWSRHRPTPPQLALAAPQDLDAIEPLVAAAIRTALDDARADPGKPQALVRLAMVYHAHEMNGLAATVYEDLIRREPSEARWPYLLALVRFDLGDTEAALELLERSIALRGGYAPAHWRRGFLLLDEGRTDEAQRSFRRALEASSSAEAATVGLARVHLMRGEPAEAVEVLERLVGSRPLPYYHQLLGSAYRQVGRHEEARLELAKATGDVPSWPDPLREAVQQTRTGYRGIIDSSKRLIATGQANEALRQLRSLEKTYLDDVTILNWIGVACFQTGRHVEAMRSLKRALDFDGAAFATHGNLAYGYEHATPPDLARSMEHAQRSVQINPANGQGYLQIGRLHIMAGAYGPAAEALRLALEYGVDNDETRIMHAQVLNAAGRWDEAGPIFERVIALHPDSAVALVGLARTRMEMGRLDEARAALDRARQLDPREPTLLAAVNRLREIEGGGG